MQQFQELLVSALAKTMADGLILSEQAMDRAAQDAAIALLKQLCSAALDPSLTDAQALMRVRRLCREAHCELRARGF